MSRPDAGPVVSPPASSGYGLVVDLPGKWMLAGEYSALTPRGLALAAAVRPGFRLELRPATGAAFRLDGASFSSLPPGPAGASPVDFMEQAWLEAAAWKQSHPPSPGTSLAEPTSGHRLSSSPHTDGFEAVFSRLPATGPRPGSSAALVVGMIAALDRWWGLGLSVEQQIALARRAHSQVQGGGSGYDVSTVALGGIVLSRATGGPKAQSRPALQGLFLVCARATAKVPTTRHIEAFRSALSRTDFRRALTRHVRASNSLVRLLWEWPASPPHRLAWMVEACERTLTDLSATGRLRIFTPEIRAMQAVARRQGIPARISGGGGGDAVVAFAPGPHQAQRLSDAFAASGWPASVLDPDSPCGGPETLLVSKPAS